MNYILFPSYSKTYGKEPGYNKTSFQRTHFANPLAKNKKIKANLTWGGTCSLSTICISDTFSFFFFSMFFILVSPEITLQSKYYVGRENSVSLDCKVEGYPPPTITWTPCDAPNVCDRRMLNISKVQNDSIYTCTAKNSLGNDSASTSLGKSFYLMCVRFLRRERFCQ